MITLATFRAHVIELDNLFRAADFLGMMRLLDEFPPSDAAALGVALYQRLLAQDGLGLADTFAAELRRLATGVWKPPH